MFPVITDIYQRDIIDHISIETFLETLRNPEMVRKARINKLRSLERGSKEYRLQKKMLPAIGCCFKYQDEINNKSIIEPSGYLYIDVDQYHEEIDFSMYPYIVAAWDSISGTGKGILVSVRGVNENNLLRAVKQIAMEIGVTPDTASVSKDRLNFLSYDENPYYNPIYSEYSYLDEMEIKLEKVDTHTLSSSSLRLRPNVRFFDENFRTDNLGEFTDTLQFNGEPFIDLGDNTYHHYVDLVVPPNLKEGTRNAIIFSVASNGYGLNPNVSKARLSGYVMHLNESNCNPPLPFEEVCNIVDKVYKKEPQLYSNRKRRIIFNPDYDFSGKERASIATRHINQKRAIDTINRILDVIEDWDFEKDGRIFYNKIAKKIGKSSKTIRRHKAHFEEIIKKLNEKL